MENKREEIHRWEMKPKLGVGKREQKRSGEKRPCLLPPPHPKFRSPSEQRGRRMPKSETLS